MGRAYTLLLALRLNTYGYFWRETRGARAFAPSSYEWHAWICPLAHVQSVHRACILSLKDMPGKRAREVSVISGPLDKFFKRASKCRGERTARERSARGHGSAKSRD